MCNLCKKKYIIALIGASGSGKDSIKDKILEKYPTITPLIRLSTRPMREGETQFNPYLFLSEQALQKMALKETEEFLEVEQQRDWFYATHKRISFQTENESGAYIGCYSADSIDILYGTCELEENIELIPILIEAEGKVRLLRQISREETPDCYEICRRYLSDLKDYGTDFDFPHYVVNNNGTYEECLSYIYDIIDSEVFLLGEDNDIMSEEDSDLDKD